MRDKMTITITDLHGSKHFTVHQIIKKVILYIIAIIFLLFIVAALVIYFLNHEIETLNTTISELEKRRIALETEYRALEKENGKLKEKIAHKSEELKSMEDRIGEIEMMIGVKPLPQTDVWKRIDFASIDAQLRHRILQMIPNGSPVPFKGVTSRFGWRINPILKRKEFHRGIDLKAKRGTPVRAPADGIVEFANMQKRSGYGNLLIISHNYGFKTFYGHLKSFKVKLGDSVKKGDIVAYTGNTGLSNGPHLHYEIRYLQMTLNPRNFMKWNIKNFSDIFEKEKRVKWASLIDLLMHQSKNLPSQSQKPSRPQTERAQPPSRTARASSAK
ncbi:peptidoglycan DD-metalloendopeptidase family protein [Hydrogenimonas sp.]